MSSIDVKTALEIANHEAVVRQAYKDSVGVLTWSIGITNATGHRVNRYIDNPASMEKCLSVFAWALEDYAEDVRKAFKGKALTQAQFCAALSFHYNTGGIARAYWVKRFLAGDVKGARKAFMSWSKPKEIIGRREAERDLFFDGKWSGDGTILEYTRVRSNLTPDWGSAKRVDIRQEMERALAPKVVPKRRPAVTEVAKDAAAVDRTSTTEIGAALTGVSGTVAAGSKVADAVENASTTLDTFMAAGPWVLVVLMAAGGAWWIWKERRRKARDAREALA